MASCYDFLCFHHVQQNIVCWLWRVVPSAIILVVVVVFVLIFGVIPHIHANVEDARLNAFEFVETEHGATTTTPFFRYNISVALAVRNANRAMSIRHTKPLIATFVFNDRRLHNLTVVDEGHRHRPGKTELHPIHVNGEVPSFLLGVAAAEEFKVQNATGVFKVEVRLSGKITYQRIVIAKKRKLSLSCQLGLQLAPPGPEVVVFHEVSCEPVKQDMIYF